MYVKGAHILTCQIEKKIQKIPKVSKNPKNQNGSENVSLKIEPCRPGKLGPFSHEKKHFPVVKSGF